MSCSVFLKEVMNVPYDNCVKIQNYIRILAEQNYSLSLNIENAILLLKSTTTLILQQAYIEFAFLSTDVAVKSLS